MGRNRKRKRHQTHGGGPDFEVAAASSPPKQPKVEHAPIRDPNLIKHRQGLPIYSGACGLHTFSATAKRHFFPCTSDIQPDSPARFVARDALLKEISAQKSTIIIGETGSGKTTQIPQYLWEQFKGFGGGIAITQPRRLAAVTTAACVLACFSSLRFRLLF